MFQTESISEYSGADRDRHFQLSFRSLFNSGRGFAFPCNALGQVDMERMTDKARNNYLFARAMVGRDLSPPAVEMVA